MSTKEKKNIYIYIVTRQPGFEITSLTATVACTMADRRLHNKFHTFEWYGLNLNASYHVRIVYF